MPVVKERLTTMVPNLSIKEHIKEATKYVMKTFGCTEIEALRLLVVVIEDMQKQKG
jgi:hypothetical protein